MSDLPSGYMLVDSSSRFRTQGFNQCLGPFYYRLAENSVELAIRINPIHLNPDGTPHGGFIATMADLALGGTVLSIAPHGMATISLTVNYMDAARVGEWLECAGTLGKAGRNIAFASGKMMVGERPIAHAAGVFKIFSARRS